MTAHFTAIASGVLVSGLFALAMVSNKKKRPWEQAHFRRVRVEWLPTLGLGSGSTVGQATQRPNPATQPSDPGEYLGGSLGECLGGCEKTAWVNGGSSDPAHPPTHPPTHPGGLSCDRRVSVQGVPAAYVAAELDAELDVNVVDSVIWHIEQRTGKHKTIEAVWGVKKGGSKRFRTARHYYEQIDAIYQAEIAVDVVGGGV